MAHIVKPHLVRPHWFASHEIVEILKINIYIGGIIVEEKLIERTSEYTCHYGKFYLINIHEKGWKLDMSKMKSNISENCSDQEVHQFIHGVAQDARQEQNYWFAAFITRMLKNTKF